MDDLTIIKSDPMEIYKDLCNTHKEISGEEVLPATEISYEYSTIASLLGIIKLEMNNVALQNYLQYAKGERLNLKNLYGSRGDRLEKNRAKTTMRCYLSHIVGKDIVIPLGTRFIYKNYIFHTNEEYRIRLGETYIDVQVECETAGDLGKILIGEIKEIVDRYDYYEKCENITEVIGGRDEEADKDYRIRLQELPESFASAGSEGAYKFHAKKASSLVTDVVIKSPSENILDIYVSNYAELISQEEKNSIKNYLEQKDIKALGDKISIKDPEILIYDLEIEYYTYKDARISIDNLTNKIEEKILDWSKNKRIGDSLNIQDIVLLCKSEKEVKRIVIKKPISDIEAKDIGLLKCNSVSLKFLGSEER